MRLEDILFAIIIIMGFVIIWFILVVMSPESIVEAEIISIRSHHIEYDKEELYGLLQDGYCAGGKLEHLEVSIWHCKEM